MDPNQTYRFAPRPMPGMWNQTGTDFHGSISGWERNHLFLSVDAGAGFVDLSALSGADDDADARAFGWLDADRDGWLDLAVVNANRPFFRLFHNRIGARPEAAARGEAVLALRFVGANHTAAPAPGRSNRDGIGARVEVVPAGTGADDAGGRRIVRAHQAGEGFAAQNSPTMLIALGADAAPRYDVTVRWPSGTVRTARDVAPGTLLIAHEAARDGSAPGPETHFERRTYAPPAPPAHAAPAPPSTGRLDWVADLPGAAPLTVVTTMATWCPSCKRELPQIARLRAAFPEQALRLIALPIDPSDSVAMLERYLEEHRPAYRLTLEDREARVAEAKALALETIRRDVLPTSFLLAADGRVLRVLAGAPTVSDLRALGAGATDQP